VDGREKEQAKEWQDGDKGKIEHAFEAGFVSRVRPFA
jgi:hypothetical protein